VLVAQKNLNDIKAFLLKLTKVQNGKETLTFDVSAYEKEFIAAMDDDFNSPKAIAAIFNVMNAVNKQIWQLSTAQAKHIHTFIAGWLTKLGISSLDIEIPQEIEKLANERELQSLLLPENLLEVKLFHTSMKTMLHKKKLLLINYIYIK
jgi:cysteinyl-tRNA synthetase